MVSTLNPKVEVAVGLREIVRGWLDEAIEALADGATAGGVHQARKACKRARAALDLLGGQHAREVSRTIADAARLLSNIRDVDVMEQMIAEHGWSIPLPRVGDRDVVATRAASELDEARQQADRLRYERAEEHHLRARLVETWRTARRAMRRAAAGDADLELFHDWRKRVKRTHAQCVLLSEHHPALLPLIRDLDELQEVLGTLHDLTVLRELSPTEQPEVNDEIALHVHRAIARGQVALALRAKEFSRVLTDKN